MTRIRPSWIPPSTDNGNNEHVLGYDITADVVIAANGLWWWQDGLFPPTSLRALLWLTSNQSLLADSGTVSTVGFALSAWNFVPFSAGFLCASNTTYTVGIYCIGTLRYDPTDLTSDQVSGDGHVRALANFGRFVNGGGAIFPTSTWSGMHAVDLDYTLAPATAAFPFNSVYQPRRVRRLPIRSRPALPVPPQAALPAEVTQPRRQHGWLSRRGRQATPVPPQVVLVPPAYPPSLVTSRRRAQRLAPRGRHWAPPWPQVINPIPFRDLILTYGRVSLKWVLGLFAGTQVPAWSFRELTTKWSVGRVTVAGSADAPLSALSLEYVRVPVIATANGLAVDPRGDVVKMAFLQGAATQPTVGDWKTASWDAPGTGKFFAQCLVGPGGAIALTAGTWYVWIQITDNPEVPVRQVGVLQVV